MANERDFRFKLRDEIYGDWIRAIETKTKGSPQGAIALAATLKSLNNNHTNAQGQLAGLARGRILEKQQEHDSLVSSWAGQHAGFAPTVEAKMDLDRRGVATRDFLFQIIKPGPLALYQATTLVRLAFERAKPDAERDPDHMNRELPALSSLLERQQKSFYRPADEAMLKVWVDRAWQLGAGERIKAVDTLVPRDRISQTVAALYAGTKVTDPVERAKMFEETPAQLRARKDPLLDLALALEPDLRAWQTEAQIQEGAVARLRPLWRRAVIAYAGKPVAPDANSTLRVSFARVKGYSPRDGILFTPQTTLAGMIEKKADQEEFSIPSFVLDAARLAQPEQIPLNFLADADTTGGNSGSPVINGRGELVGLNFDRVWENVANDFGYNPDVARNISVDIRFLMWLLETQKADFILKEVGQASRPVH